MISSFLFFVLLFPRFVLTKSRAKEKSPGASFEFKKNQSKKQHFRSIPESVHF